MKQQMTAFSLTDEQQFLRDSLRKLLQSKSDSAAVRAAMNSGAERGGGSLWHLMAEQLGLHGIAIPEKFGGLGYGIVELSVIAGELGRALTVTPFFASVVLAATALQDSGDEEAMATILPRIASGEIVATLAVSDSGIDVDGAAVHLSATPSQGGWRLSGTKSIVLEALAADVLLVIARTSAGLSLFVAEADALGVSRESLSVMDLTRHQGRIVFDQAPAALVGRDGDADRWLPHTLDVAAVVLAAEQVGGAQRCIDMAVEYAKLRYQFGRPIGSYQAISHKCVDMLTEIEMARSTALYAAAVADNGDVSELPIAASLAKHTCSEAYTFAAGQNIQVHGGIGVTWEHDAHLYYKRAKSSEFMYGDPLYHRSRLGNLLGL